MSIILGVMGQSGSGKDTVADFLVNGFGFAKISFADPMKRFCKELFDFTDDQLWGPSQSRNAPDERYVRKQGSIENWEEAYLTPRYALQRLGTEWGRDCYQDIWAEYAMRIAKKLLGGYYDYSPQLGLQGSIYAETPAGVVIPDMRFRNEMDAVQSHGGKVIRVVRPGYEGKVGISGHASEEEQKTIPDSAFNVVIQNDGTLEDLYAKVARAVKEMS